MSLSLFHTCVVCGVAWCGRLSKALAKSIPTTSLCFQSVIPLSMSLVNSINWVSVESLDLKPCWWLYRMLFLVRCCITWLATMCSIHLHRTREGNRAVVGCFVLLIFLKYLGYICNLPVFSHFCVFWGTVDEHPIGARP